MKYINSFDEPKIDKTQVCSSKARALKLWTKKANSKGKEFGNISFKNHEVDRIDLEIVKREFRQTEVLKAMHATNINWTLNDMGVLSKAIIYKAVTHSLENKFISNLN